jgi:hypothetical protein
VSQFAKHGQKQKIQRGFGCGFFRKIDRSNGFASLITAAMSGFSRSAWQLKAKRAKSFSSKSQYQADFCQELSLEIRDISLDCNEAQSRESNPLLDDWQCESSPFDCNEG